MNDEKAESPDAQPSIAHYEKKAAEWLDKSAEYIRQFDRKRANVKIRDFVSQYPGRTILMASGIGLIIGAILRRR